MYALVASTSTPCVTVLLLRASMSSCSVTPRRAANALSISQSRWSGCSSALCCLNAARAVCASTGPVNRPSQGTGTSLCRVPGGADCSACASCCAVICIVASSQ